MGVHADMLSVWAARLRRRHECHTRREHEERRLQVEASSNCLIGANCILAAVHVVDELCVQAIGGIVEVCELDSNLRADAKHRPP